MGEKLNAEAEPVFRKMVQGKVVLVTGGTGSFGRAFCRYVLRNYSVRKLIVFSRDEFKQFRLAQDPLVAENKGVMRYYIGDVRDKDRLRMAFRGVDFVIHAAALKQIPTAEYNPFEAVKTNVIGAQNVIEAAIETDVTRVVALSSDKAANPVNLYGATKLCADKLFIAANNYAGALHPTRFSVVRYGNVVGSRGSVIPVFLAQRKNGVIEITHPEMTRFWITLEQGVQMVLKALLCMHGGEIFVPKIPSMRVVDLARIIAPGLPQKIIGIRPGEKLHEVIITFEDARTTYDFADHYRIMPPFLFSPEVPNIFYPKGAVEGGKPVSETFYYSSDTNTWWLTDAEMARICEDETDAIEVGDEG
jgi:UDP-N-acetylglucosamine 4,6-dehydratase